jgi:hypothetical protein
MRKRKTLDRFPGIRHWSSSTASPHEVEEALKSEARPVLNSIEQAQLWKRSLPTGRAT